MQLAVPTIDAHCRFRASLEQAVGELVKISEAIERLFKVPSEIDREFMQKYIDEKSKDPENQSISDEEPRRDGDEDEVCDDGDRQHTRRVSSASAASGVIP